MAIDIEGWIEFSPYVEESERQEEYAWLTWMDISSIVCFNDEVNWVIFGNPRDFKNERPKYIPIAKNRGIPVNLGYHLKSDIRSAIDYEKENDNGEIFGFTYFYFSEIEEINWKEKYQILIDESDWGKLFALTKEFKKLKRINSNQIRFTVWYSW